MPRRSGRRNPRSRQRLPIWYCSSPRMATRLGFIDSTSLAVAAWAWLRRSTSARLVWLQVSFGLAASPGWVVLSTSGWQEMSPTATRTGDLGWGAYGHALSAVSLLFPARTTVGTRIVSAAAVKAAPATIFVFLVTFIRIGMARNVTTEKCLFGEPRMTGNRTFVAGRGTTLGEKPSSGCSPART